MKLGIFGYGGHAREVASQIGEEVTFFVDDNYSNEHTQPVSKFNPKTHMMMIAVADSFERKKIVDRLPKETEYFTFVHPTALIMDKNIEIGEGSFIGAYSIMTTNIKLGKHSILNRMNQIGHDSQIGDFCSMMPGAILSGNVKVGECLYMGNNSSVREKITICDDVVIGMNACVVKNIKESGTYGGVPVKKL